MKDFKDFPEEWIQMFKRIPLKNDSFDEKDIYAQKLREALDGLTTEDSKHRPSRMPLRNSRIWTWAAVWIGIIITGTISYYAGEQNIRTMESELVCYLPDSSRVTLSRHSEISYNSFIWLFSRSLDVKGEALFKVNRGKKFTVSTEAGFVQILGTEFKLRQKDEDLLVECFEGCVKVATKEKSSSTILHPNEKVSIEKGKMSEKSTIVPDQTSSRPQYLEFMEESLTDIFLEMQNLFHIKIESNDSSINALTFTGILPCDNQEQALDILLECCGLSYNSKNGVIQINKKQL